jgi:BirA family biotin operon repressor/biotin-[acetyl-CoA-carboxylase] ligase
MEADTLSPDIIAEGLGTCWLARNIVYYETVGSTNDEARRLALAGAPEGTLVIAEEQTAGRGRLQRRWLAPRGQALLFSLIFYPSFDARDAFLLTMLGSLACMRAIEEQTGLRPEIKWPNDLLLNGKKLAGMLSELGHVGDRLYAILGIGVNVNVDPAAWPQLRQQATSLREVLGHPVPRRPLLQAILRHIEAGYDRLRTVVSPFEEWAANLGTLGRSVQVTTTEGTFEGEASGVDPDGALRVTLPDGTTRRVIAGDVESLRTQGSG